MFLMYFNALVEVTLISMCWYIRMKKPPAKLRVCASCEWIFESGVECPKCQFGSYGAYYVYGSAAYRFKYSQKPWREKKLTNYEVQLNAEITEDVPERNIVQQRKII
jgi:hypothetical protein